MTSKFNRLIEEDYDVTPKPVKDYSKNPKCKMCPKHIPDLAVVHEDPFCSNYCARRFYGTQLEPFVKGGPVRKYNRPKNAKAPTLLKRGYQINGE